MPTVAELDILIDADDRATDDLARIGALIDAMNDKDFDILVRAQADQAQRDLDAAFASASRLNDQDVQVDVDAQTAAARAALDAISAVVDDINGKNADVSVTAHIGATTALLREVDAEMARLDGQRATVTVDADTATAQAKLAALWTEVQRLGSSSVTASRSINTLGFALTALAPALVPIGVVGVGGLAAFTAASASAGVGVGLFGAVAANAYSEVNDAVKQITQGEQQLKEAMTDPAKQAALLKIQMAYNALTPSQRAAVDAQLAFNKSWDAFVQRWEPQVFSMAAQGLAAITAQMSNLDPIMNGVTAGLQRLLDAAIVSLNGPVWQNFFDYLGRTAMPMVEAFGGTIGNLATGFASLLMAFEPLQLGFAAGMLRMSQAFSEWAASVAQTQGFKDFIAYVQTNGPIVMDIIRQLALLALNLIQALMPIGAVVLPIILRFLEALNRFAEAHPIIMTLVVGFAALVAAVIALSGPIAAIWAALQLLAAPVVALIGHFGGFAAVFTRVAQVAAALWPWLVNIVTALLRFAGPIAIAIAAGVALYQNWDTITAAAQRVWTAVSTWFPQIPVIIGTAFQLAVTWVQTHLATLWAVVQTIFAQVVATVIASMVQFGQSVLTGVTLAATSMVAGMAQIVQAVITGVTQFVASIVAGMVQFGQSVVAGITSAAASMIAGMASIVQAVINGVTQFVARIVAGMAQFTSSVVAGIAAAASAVVSGMATMVASIVAGMARFVASAIAGIGQFVSAIASGVGRAAGAAAAVANAVVAAVSGLAGRMRAAGVAAIQGFISGIGSMVQAAGAAARRVVSAVTSVLPGSPAKEGPLSGQGYALLRGQRLAEDLAAGVNSRIGTVAKAANRAAAALATDLMAPEGRTAAASFSSGRSGATFSGAGSASIGSGAASGQVAFNFTVNNPLAEATSVTVNKSLQRIAGLGLV